MKLIGLKDSLDKLREKGFLSDQQSALILGKQSSPVARSTGLGGTPALLPETALLCEQILRLNVQLEEESEAARHAKNTFLAKTIQKFKTALFFQAVCCYFDRKIEALQMGSSAESGGQFGLEFYVEGRGRLRRLFALAFPRFQFK